MFWRIDKTKRKKNISYFGWSHYQKDGQIAGKSSGTHGRRIIIIIGFLNFDGDRNHLSDY